jgi:serine/threonine protein kinase
METTTIKTSCNLDITSNEDVEKVLENLHFKITKQIGEGSYGKVYKIHHVIEKKDFVAKLVEIKIDENTLLEFTKKEIEILYQETHKNLIKLHFYKNFSNGLLLVLEYAEKGDLYQYFVKSSLDENHFFSVFNEIFNGIKYLHSKKIQHRDLKLENILVTKDDIIKICDFGLAQKIDELHITHKTTIRYKKADQVGTPYCLSPEAIGNKEAPFGSVDIWSLGCISYHLIFGFYPFERYNVNYQ